MALHRARSYSGRRNLAAGIIAALLALLGAGVATAAPAPPTEGGNGAGQSGQCTGAAADRPTACVSPGGVAAQ